MRKKLKAGTVLGASFLTLLSAGVTLGAGYVFYNREILYPSALSLEEEMTGRYALSQFQNILHSNSLKNLTEINGKSYLANETSLQNGNKSREQFIKKVLGTVAYKPMSITRQNKYGGDYFPNGEFGETEEEVSYVVPGEKVSVFYIDYKALEFPEDEIKELLESKEINFTDENFTDELIDAFSDFVVNKKELPIKTITREVQLDTYDDGSYSIAFEEDEWLDQELFSSFEFRDALDRFSEVAIGENKVESKEYKDWVAGDKKDKEPYQWDTARYIPYGWIGFYDVLEGNSDSIDNYVMPSGDGSFENPAGLNTPILTSIIQKNDKGEEKEYPIKVTLLKVSYGSDAIKDLIALNGKNRGLDPKSHVKYIYTEWRVESLSGEKITFTENSALSDKEGNISDRTGVMYGLADIAELEPYQWTELQGWYSSTELSEKYLVWGRDFSKQQKPIWFKALQLSDKKVEIPEDKIQTDDISANKNETAVEFDE